MVRRRVLIGAATILALAGARPAAAGAIQFATGNAETDMKSSTPGVLTIVNRTDPFGPSAPAQDAYMTSEGKINGWVIKDMRVHYDEAGDRLYVGVNFFGIAGDADGNGVVGTTDSRFVGTENARLGLYSQSDATITVGIDLTGSGKPTFVAGISSDKKVIGPGTDGFSVNWYNETNAGLGTTYGASLNAHNANLAFEPSAAHPDFEFSIAAFSKIPGFNKDNGFGFIVKSGASDDGRVGEEDLPYTKVTYQQITTPEPATMIAWSIVAAGASWRGIKRRRKSGPSVA